MIYSQKATLAVFLAGVALVGLLYLFLGKDMITASPNNNTAAVSQQQNSSTTVPKEQDAAAADPQQYDFIATVPPEFIATGCDSSLWEHNAEEERVAAPCIYVTGVVMRVKSEDDGDMNIQLKPDPQYAVLMNSYNIKDGESNIGIEPICVVGPSKKSFIKSCAGYTNAVFIPKVGMHIGVKGSYGQDKHRWMEMHPVTSISVL